MDRLHPFVRIGIQTFAATLPDLLVGRADIQHMASSRLAKKEHVAYPFRHLPKTQFAVLQISIRLFFCRYVDVHDDSAIAATVGQGRYFQEEPTPFGC